METAAGSYGRVCVCDGPELFAHQLHRRCVRTRRSYMMSAVSQIITSYKVRLLLIWTLQETETITEILRDIIIGFIGSYIVFGGL